MSSFCILTATPTALASEMPLMAVETLEGEIEFKALPYYYDFINPQPGDTVSGTENIQFYCHYNGYQLYPAESPFI
jgi:hypothetical protein